MNKDHLSSPIGALSFGAAFAMAALMCMALLAGCAATAASGGDAAAGAAQQSQADDGAEGADAADAPSPTTSGETSSETSVEGGEVMGAGQSASSSEALPTRVRISFDGGSATVQLADTDAARTFAALLPVTLEMGDLNGNEKYVYLDAALPASASAPGAVAAGDLMLYGDDCVVLFYESFATPYSYTRIGQVDDFSAIASMAGVGSVSVAFEAA